MSIIRNVLLKLGIVKPKFIQTTLFPINEMPNVIDKDKVVFNLINFIYDNKFTYAKIAKTIGVSPSTVYYWSRRLHTPTKKNVEKINALLNTKQN